MIANRYFALWNSRRLIIEKILEQGHEVICIANPLEDPVGHDFGAKLRELGATTVDLPIPRGAQLSADDARSIARLGSIIRRAKPDLVHAFNAKPVLYSYLLGKLHRGVQVSSMTGMPKPLRADALNRSGRIIHSLLHQALTAADVAVFQNDDDLQSFNSSGVVPATFTVIRSSGVDTDRFSVPEGSRRPGPVRVLKVARLLESKGVRDYIALAEQIPGEEIDFILAGEPQPGHTDTVPLSVVQEAVSRGSVEYVGFVGAVEDLMRDADIIVLLSQGEGFPRTLLEGSACGRPVLGYDVAGVREAVVDGHTGYLVPVGDLDLAIFRLTQLVEDESLRSELGSQGHRFVEKNFDIGAIAAKHIDIYASLGVL